LDKSPFEVLYGYAPRYFGLSASDACPTPEIQNWFDERALMQESVRQHLLRVKQRMKNQADKKRTERQFSVGDKVFLKLQPYAQSSVVKRASHKLAFKYFGPFAISRKIGSVAYELVLPSTSRIHPVFHVSQLKPFLPSSCQVSPQLPSFAADLQVPISILQQRMIQRGKDTITQALVQWSESTPELATWEDLDSLKQRFPRAPAWGQAVSKGAGIVSNTDDGSSIGPQHQEESRRPVRMKRVPARLADSVWQR